MLVVFEKVTRAVVQHMDAGGDMIAVRSLIDGDRFHCFYLDILEMDKGEGLFDKLVPGLQGPPYEVGERLCLCLRYPTVNTPLLSMRSEVKSQRRLKGKFDVKLPKEKTLDMGITFSRSLEQGIELSKTRILQKFLDSIKNKKLKRSKEPPMFQSVQAMREDLYLVTETLKTTKTVILKSEKQYIFWDPMKCFGLRYEHKHQTEVTITPEKVLGYRVKQPVFPNAEIMGIRFSRAEKKNPFQKSLSLEDFPSVKERMQDMVRVLQNPTEERKEVLSCFTKCLSKDEELQDLERRVRGPRKNWGREREEPPPSFLPPELSEEGQLVAEALVKGTPPFLKDKVEPILEQNQGEQPRDVGCDPEARTLCALYVVVSILLQLGEKPTSVSS
ncbi:hypothetical protein EI555_016976 [Monodon monoceros]|uniref:Gasdermin pore forming domain-containing protein n=1 Tax=Monodon monoceros TaxID=40151 RepID=A0A4U1FI89_MONMO|nr:hypothetical protein EI555_016976 [Monodon monoceros]